MLLAASAGALAVACAPSSTGDGGADDGGGGDVVRVEHRYGVTEVPGTPRRIVTVGLTEQDYPLAFGVAPVLTREWFGNQPGALWPWAAERAGTAVPPPPLAVAELDMERVAAAEPDLVLAMNSGVDPAQYELLSGIAPTIAQPPGTADYGARWDDMTRTVGRVLRRDAEAERLVADLTARLDAARTDLAAAGRTGLLASAISGSLYLYPTGPAPSFLRDMGLRLPDAAVAAFGDPATAPPLPLSSERTDLLEADVLLLGLYGGATQASALAGPLASALRVVREGRVVALPEMSLLNGALSFSSVLSLPLVLDGLVPRLAAALDGDPATPVAAVT